MNPIATLYHIAPCCFVFLALPFTYMELPRMFNDPKLSLDWRTGGWLLLSAVAAFGETRYQPRLATRQSHTYSHNHTYTSIAGRPCYLPAMLFLSSHMLYRCVMTASCMFRHPGPRHSGIHGSLVLAHLRMRTSLCVSSCVPQHSTWQCSY